MKHKLYCNAFLEARIKNKAKTLSSFAPLVKMKPEALRRKIRNEQYFTLGEIGNMISVLNVTNGNECRLLFFLHKENASMTHYNLYKAILGDNVPPIKIALELSMSLEDLFSKIMGEKEFRWNEVITIKEKFFPDYTMSSLFERGVSV